MPRPPRKSAGRRGFSMVLVMLAIGFSLALTYGFMRTQVTSLQLSQNDTRRDLALEAARTGISAGLLRMQSASWAGVTDTYAKTTQQDSTNLVTCNVTYGAVTSGMVAGLSDAELPLHVSITSKGTWTSPRDSTITVTRTIRAVVRLMPRIPGRTARAGDVATATDQSTNPANYQATLPYTLTTTASTSTSLNFDPGSRIEGPIWLSRKLALFNAETWSSSIRATMLTEIGNQYGAASSTSFVHPHPVNGPIRFSSNPSSGIQTDLSRLKTSWSTAAGSASVTALNANSWLSYRLYDRGPVYQATVLSSSLSNVTLRPTVSNPLGIYVRSGNLDVYDQVNVQGTLVVTGTLTLWGVASTVTSYNWISSSGSPAVSGADQWPRLPSIVAKDLSISSSSQVVVEGAVQVDSQISGGGGDYLNPSANQVYLSGTATATCGQQPYSTIQLNGSPDLSSVTGGLNYAIWLANGTTGRWYQIQSVDSTAKRLTVIGEAVTTSPVSYTIRLNRTQFASFHGPVVAGSVNLSDENEWSVWAIIWSNTYSNWVSANNSAQSAGRPRTSFCDWVANPGNLTNVGWFVPWQTAIYGMELEPTVSFQPTTGINYLVNLPLFTPYTSTGSDSAASGYRWKIVDWREDI